MFLGILSVAVVIAGQFASAQFRPPIGEIGLNRPAQDLRVIHRQYNIRTGDHMASSNPDEAITSGYRNEGPVYLIDVTYSPDSQPIFRCRVNNSGNDHFLSTDPNCEGHIFEHLLGYAATQPDRIHQAALTRCYNSRNGDHLETLDISECHRAGYRVEMTLGFVLGI